MSRAQMEVELQAIDAEIERQALTMNAMNYAMRYGASGTNPVNNPLWSEFARASGVVAYLDEVKGKLEEMIACL